MRTRNDTLLAARRACTASAADLVDTRSGLIAYPFAVVKKLANIVFPHRIIGCGQGADASNKPNWRPRWPPFGHATHAMPIASIVAWLVGWAASTRRPPRMSQTTCGSTRCETG